MIGSPLLRSALMISALAASGALFAQPDPVRTVASYHLTARPWSPIEIPSERYLEAVEGVCRFSIRHQDASGAIIDPFLKREHQYATPYFAYAVGALIHEGRAPDLLPHGIRAMEHATACFGRGRAAIPDTHGEFFIPVLTGALALYEKHVPAEQLARWRERMKKPTDEAVRGFVNNWETYVLKGDWMRVQAGLIDRKPAIARIETAWRERHRARIAPAPFFLYHDRTSDPDTLSVEAVGRGNLLALTHLGYDGPSASEIREIVEAATRTTLFLQDPSGQAPTNGRTDNHVWVDIGYQLAFEVMAERLWERGEREEAGQFRRAAILAFQNVQRWRRSDGEWAGSYYVTKSRFAPDLRVGHQPASQYSNYNGSFMFHLAEAFHVRKSPIPERPTPSEIGGYALRLDPEFASAFANAGGMQIQANLRGQVEETHDNRWTPLGVVRLARAGWDTRLGPSDGALQADGGVSFAPAFLEKGRWLRMADLSDRYEGEWSVEFAHPLLVRCAIEYSPKAGRSGPRFRQRLTLTPDGVLSEVTKLSGEAAEWGVTWPLLVDDGLPLRASISGRTATTAYPRATDEQHFLAVQEAARVAAEPRTIRSTYGDLRPMRVTVPEERNVTFVYPRSEGDPAAAAVLAGFRLRADGFSSVLGRVTGTLYVGRYSAGGYGRQLDLDGDGRPDVSFDRDCGFLLQTRSGRIVAVETDRTVTAKLGARTVRLQAYSPEAIR